MYSDPTPFCRTELANFTVSTVWLDGRFETCVFANDGAENTDPACWPQAKNGSARDTAIIAQFGHDLTVYRVNRLTPFDFNGMWRAVPTDMELRHHVKRCKANDELYA